MDGQIAPSKHCDLVLEDEDGICGFALALIDAKTAITTSQVRQRTPLALIVHNFTVQMHNCILPTNLFLALSFKIVRLVNFAKVSYSYQAILMLVH